MDEPDLGVTAGSIRLQLSGEIVGSCRARPDLDDQRKRIGKGIERSRIIFKWQLKDGGMTTTSGMK